MHSVFRFSLIFLIALTFAPSLFAQNSCRRLFMSPEEIQSQIKARALKKDASEKIDLWQVYKNSSLSETEYNQTQIENLRTEKLPEPSPGRMTGVSFPFADEVLRFVKEHPLNSREKAFVYDPQGIFGYCWGRAMHIHIELLKRGVDKTRIRKIWALGDFDPVDRKLWTNHVATMVKAEDGGWYVIDTLLPEGVIAAEAWYERMKMSDGSPDPFRIFITSAKKYGAFGTDHYAPHVIKPDDSYGYFTDLLKWLRKDSRREILRRRTSKAPAQ
jgi:hypothetical protein